MIKSFIFAALLFGSALGLAAQTKENRLLSPDFWKGKPTIAQIKAQIHQGADPAEKNGRQMDATTLAILADASPTVVDFLVAQEGNDINKQTHHFRTYLHWAASRGSVEIVKLLLSLGADIKALDEHGNTPLIYALRSGQIAPELLEAFAEEGYDLTERTLEGQTLLMLGIGNDREEKLQSYLLGKGLKLSDTDKEGASLTDYALQSGRLDIAQQLENQHDIKPSPIALLRVAKGQRRHSNKLEVYQYLIEQKGQDARIKDAENNTLLHLIASRPGQLEIIRYLISKGVDPREVNNEGDTPFLLASLGQDLPQLELLRPHAGDINRANKRGETALLLALERGSASTTEYLLKEGADLNVKDIAGEGFLYRLSRSYRQPRHASEIDQFSAKLQLLTDKGVDWSQAKLHDGSTLYHDAVGRSSLDMLEKVSKLGIDVNAVNETGLTALHKAALTARSTDILKRLLELGADKTIKTDLGESVYELAEGNEYLKQYKTDISFLK